MKRSMGGEREGKLGSADEGITKNQTGDRIRKGSDDGEGRRMDFDASSSSWRVRLIVQVLFC